MDIYDFIINNTVLCYAIMAIIVFIFTAIILAKDVPKHDDSGYYFLGFIGAVLSAFWPVFLFYLIIYGTLKLLRKIMMGSKQ